MKKELYCLRMEPQMKKEVGIISRVLHVSESEWLRNKIAYDIKETLDTLRTQIALEYARGKIKEKELREIFGDEASEVIKFTLKQVKEDLAEAKGIAKKIKAA